jgi:hypothetical protein
MGVQKNKRRCNAGSRETGFRTNGAKLTASAKEFADAIVRIYQKQQGAGKRKSAHNEGHMLRTAVAAADYVMKNPHGLKVEDKKKLARIAAVTGLLHDLVRLPHEIKGRQDGIVTADLLEQICGAMNHDQNDVRVAQTQLVDNYPQEMKTVREFLSELGSVSLMMGALAIRINEGSVKQILEASGQMLEIGRDEQALLNEALMFGDKGLEGLGSSVIVRRAQFVSGERAENPEDVGALKKDILAHAHTEEEFRLFAFIGESMIRIYSNKSLADFPKNECWDEAKAGREIELKVYRSLLDHFDIKCYLTEHDVFKYLLGMGFPKMGDSEERITSAIDDAGSYSSIDSSFRKDAIYLVLGLAYSQSKDEDLRAKSADYLGNIKHEEIRSMVGSSNTDELKARFVSYFE